MATSGECSCSGTRSCLSCEQNHLELKSSDLTKESLELEDFKKFDFCLICRGIVPDRTECLHEDSETNIIHGLDVFQEFVSESEEAHIVKEIDKTYWKPSQSGRRKQDYGPQVNFKRKKVKLTYFNGLPSFSKFVIERMQKNVSSLSDFKTVELCNLEYIPERGSSIDPHFDDFWLWGERLVTINLLSDTIITMSNDDTKVQIDVELPRRSLVIMSGPSRHEWKHGIKRGNITSRRIAITFRELSKEFLNGGPNEALGSEVYNIASSFSGSSVQVNMDSCLKSSVE